MLSLLATAVLTVLWPQPAQAAVSTYVTESSWAFTDSRRPRTAFIDQDRDAPVGAWRDERGRVHTSRSYFTFDLSAFRGKRVTGATLVVSETKVNDCQAKRTVEVWRTNAITASTSWAKPPREIGKVATLGGTVCPAGYLEADVAAAVGDALAGGGTSLTLALRVPSQLERNVAYGRSVDHRLGISVRANTAPDTPGPISVNGRSCAAPGQLFVGEDYRGVTVSVDIDDADAHTGGGDWLTPSFALWPEAAPAERVQWQQSAVPPGRMTGQVPDGVLREDVRYVLTAWATDPDGDSSPVSDECRFTFDRTRPDRAPGVVSTDYPEEPADAAGGPGIAGDFTFSPSGVEDVAGYRYGIDGAYEYVAADRLGGPVTVPVTPSRWGYQRLVVHSVDRAGNPSPPAEYEFRVRDTAPRIEDADPDAWLGDPRTITLRSTMDDVVSFTYTVDDAAAVTIPARPDGTASITIVPNAQGTTLHVYSTTAAGRRSGTAWDEIRVSTTPYVESADFPMDGSPGLPVGEEGTFTFKPRMHGVVEYVYQFNRYQEDERPVQTVRAQPDGTATVRYAGRSIGLNTIDVFARTADGTESTEAGWAFYPRSIAPDVSSAEYPAYTEAGGPGVTGTFEIRPGTTGVESYEYQFAEETPRSVPARPDGTAAIEWTPQEYPSTWGGWVTLKVRSHSADGRISNWAYYSIHVSALNPTVVSDRYEHGRETGGVGQTGTFTVTTHLPGSTTVHYRFDDEPVQTAAVGPDGTAELRWTPTTAYSHSLTVWSSTADGRSSGPLYRSIWVPAG